jgi:hypothetical protein
MAVLIAALPWHGGATSVHAATNACTSASMASTAPQAPGTTVTFMANSTGCLTPEFKFFLQTAGGAWVPKTGYSTYRWTLDTTGYAAGVYGVGFWVRQTGSTAAYEEYWIGTFTLMLVLCESATLTLQALTEPAPAGTKVTFNAAATVCPAPQYRFWLTGPGRDWTMVRDWGAASWTWDTSGFADGVYQVGVWARQPSSANAYDTFGITTYYVGTPVTAGCSTASIYFTPATTTSPGTDVALSGSSNCPNAQYAYWLKPPGGDWVRTTSYIQPQPGQVTWTTTGLDDGTYEVGLWSKDSTQPASVPYNTYFIQTYQLAVGRCSAAAIGPQGLTSPPPVMVNFSAGATDCSTPVFQFWVLPPNSTAWRVVQAYNVSNGFTLDTTGLAPGPYRIGVWVRQNNSSVAYDSYAIMTYWVGV